MLQRRSSWFAERYWVAIAVLLALGLALPLCAEQKKAAGADTTKPGDKRTTGYFDISKIVWPGPPEIARIKFVALFTGEKIDPTLFEKKKKSRPGWTAWPVNSRSRT